MIPTRYEADQVRERTEGTEAPFSIIDGLDFGQAVRGFTTENNSELPIGFFSGTMSVLNGFLRVEGNIQEKPKSTSRKVLRGVEIGAAIAQIISGATKLTANVISTITSLAGTALKTNLSAISTIFGKVASGFGSIFSALTIIQPSMKIHTSRKLIEKLKAEEDLGDVDVSKLKSLAPKTYAKIGGEYITTLNLTSTLKNQMLKELNATIAESSVAITTAVLTIISTTLGCVISGGVGAVVGLGIGLVATTVSSIMDVKTMIESIKTAKGMSKKEFIIKVITIVLAAVSLALSVAFAPTVALALAAGIVGLLVMSIPIASIALLKTKQDILVNELASENEKARKKELEMKQVESSCDEKLKVLKDKIRGKINSEESYFSVFNENSKANLKLISAVNLAAGGRLVEEDSLPNRALAKYNQTAKSFVEGVKGKSFSIAKLTLQEGEKLDFELMSAISKVCDLDINGVVFPKAIIQNAL